jgi:hypothetical protein
MGKSEFPVPATVEETISLLNQFTWNITLVEQGMITKIVEGDQLMFTANSKAEAEAFLHACFISTFWGNSVETVRQELAKLKPGSVDDYKEHQQRLTDRKVFP